MSVTLYELPLSGNCYKVRILLHLLGLDYTRKPIDRSVLPLGKVPALEIGGKIYTESMAILCLLASGTRYLPETDLVEIIRWLSFEQGEIQMTIGVARYQLRHGLLTGSADESAMRALQVLDDHLSASQSGYVVASGLTIADIALYGYIHLAPEVGIDLTRYRHISRWLADLGSRFGVAML